MLRGFEAPTNVYGCCLSKLNGINKGTGENFSGYKRKDGSSICKINCDKDKHLQMKIPQNRYKWDPQRQTSSEGAAIIVCRSCNA